ncbi:MAG: C40 family peptidase [Burkholderiaceae bacterium]
MIVRIALAIALAVLNNASAMEAERADRALRSDIVVSALTLIDIPYRYGGSTPAAGFDCSGLVRYIYNAVTAKQLPRRSEDIGKLGEPVTRSQLEPGDLVFFNTLSRAFSHVAIYIGDGRFLHAPARGGKVRIEALDDRYWQARFNGARRIIDARDTTLAPIVDVPPEVFSVTRSSPSSPLDEAAVVIKP